MAGCRCMTARYQLAWLSCLGFVIVYLLRVNLSVALVAMVTENTTSSSASTECPSVGNVSHNKVVKPIGVTYDWDRDTQGVILSSFFYGYVLTQLPGGWWASKYGGKKLFGLGVLCTSVFTLLTPLAASLGVPVLVATRILEGLGEGVTFPATYAMWAVWAPPAERSTLVSISMAGALLGTVIGLPVSGLIYQALGWPSIFYICGAAGIVWFCLWMLLVSDSPADHKFISEEERDYLTSAIATISTHDQHTLAKTPWLEMIKSSPVWAILCINFCYTWGFYTLLTCLPMYMEDVLQFDVSQDAFLSGLPYLFMWIFLMAAGIAADAAIKRNYVSTSAARKIATAALLIPSASLAVMGYVGCDHSLVVVLLCIAGAFLGVSSSGYSVNILDISAKHSGSLSGITNTVGNIPGILAPQVVGWITSKNSTSEEWRSVFFITVGLNIFGICAFLLLGRGTLQPWAVSRNGYEPIDEVSINN